MLDLSHRQKAYLNRERNKMIQFKSETIYAAYATLKGAEKRAAKLITRGATVKIELVGNLYMIVGA